MAAMQIVAAIGDDQYDAGVEDAGQEKPKQVTRRLLSPVDVLDDQSDPSIFGELRQGAEDGVEQLDAIQPIIRWLGCHAHPAMLWEQPGNWRELGEEVGYHLRLVDGEATESLTERQVGQPGITEVKTVADQSQNPPLIRRLNELREQSRLADAGVAGHDRCVGMAGWSAGVE